MQLASDVSFAALGWLDMFNGPAGVKSLTTTTTTTTTTTSTQQQASPRVSLVVRGAGTLLLHCSRRPRVVRVCGVPLLSEWHAPSGALTVEVPPTQDDLTAPVELEWA